MWVYACPQFDAQAMQCPAGQWIEIQEPGQALTDMLPTVQDANTVGSALFVCVAILAIYRDLLSPSEE
jgi:hypothetical protein